MKKCLPWLLLILLFIPSKAFAALVLNDVVSKTVAFDLGEAPRRAEILRYVRLVRDEFYPRAELLDVRALGAETLKAKLKDSFVLYGRLEPGSLTERILKDTYGSLKVGEESLETPLFSGKGPHLRLITIAKNPFGYAPIALYCASKADLLIDINSLFHGPSSFHLFSEKLEIAKGRLGRDFTPENEALSFLQAKEDLEQFFATIEEVHPNPFAKLSRRAYEALKAKVLKQIQEDAAGGKISIKKLERTLYFAAASFGDGHTSLLPREDPTEITDGGTRFPPFLFSFRNGDFFIEKAVQRNLIGQKVLSIEGKTPRTFLKPILERCSGEILPFKAARFIGRQSFYWSLTDLLHGKKELQLSTVVKGKTAAHTLRTIPISDFLNLSFHKDWNPEPKVRFFGDIAYFIYPAFEKSEKRIAQVEEIFKQIGKRCSKHLIIDLRGNGGGNSAMSDVILKHLTHQPIRNFSGVNVKISKKARECYPGRYEKAPLGTIIKQSVEPAPLESTPDFFRGDSVLLVDNGTFSSAADFAAIVKGYKLAPILGYETGGLPHCFGDVLAFELGNSGLPFGVSYKEFFAPVPSPGDDRHGVIPDLSFTERLLGKYRGQEDPGLAIAQEFLKTAPHFSRKPLKRF